MDDESDLQTWLHFLRHLRSGPRSAATVLAFPFTLFAIVVACCLPPLGGVVASYWDFKFPVLLFVLLSASITLFLRSKRVKPGPIALYVFSNIFVVHFICGWIACLADFSSPVVYRLPVRGKAELGAYTLDLRPFSHHLIPLFRVHCQVRVVNYPFETARADQLVELDVWGSLCNEVPDPGQGSVYVEEGRGVLGTGWRRMSADEPRSLARGAMLEDYEKWKIEHDARLAREREQREADERRSIEEDSRRMERALAGRTKPAVVLATFPYFIGLAETPKEKVEKQARESAEKLSRCTGTRLEIAENAYPAGLAVLHRVSSAKAAEAWLKKAKACSPQAEIQNLIIGRDQGP